MRARRVAELRAWVVVAAAALVLAACASTQQASPERDAQAKRFLARPGISAIYVYRPEFPTAERRDPALYVDDRLIGEILPGTFFRVDVPPGKRVLDGFGPGGGGITVDALPGEIHYVSLEVGTSQARFALVAPDAAQRAIVRCCALLENLVPGKRGITEPMERRGDKDKK